VVIKQKGMMIKRVGRTPDATPASRRALHPAFGVPRAHEFTLFLNENSCWRMLHGHKQLFYQ